MQEGSIVAMHGLLLCLVNHVIGRRGTGCSHVVHWVGFLGRAPVVGSGFTSQWHGGSTGCGRLWDQWLRESFLLHTSWSQLPADTADVRFLPFCRGTQVLMLQSLMSQFTSYQSGCDINTLVWGPTSISRQSRMADPIPASTFTNWRHWSGDNTCTCTHFLDATKISFSGLVSRTQQNLPSSILWLHHHGGRKGV